jgi:hypothetical protein
MRLDSEAPEDPPRPGNGCVNGRRPPSAFGFAGVEPDRAASRFHVERATLPCCERPSGSSAHVLDSRHVRAAVQPVQDMLARVQIADVVSASDRSTWNDSHPASFPRGLRARCMSARPPPGQIRREGRQSLFT